MSNFPQSLSFRSRYSSAVAPPHLNLRLPSDATDPLVDRNSTDEKIILLYSERVKFNSSCAIQAGRQESCVLRSITDQYCSRADPSNPGNWLSSRIRAARRARVEEPYQTSALSVTQGLHQTQGLYQYALHCSHCHCLCRCCCSHSSALTDPLFGLTMLILMTNRSVVPLLILLIILIALPLLSPCFLAVSTALPIHALPTLPNSPANVSKKLRRSILGCAAFPLPPVLQPLPPLLQPLQYVDRSLFCWAVLIIMINSTVVPLLMLLSSLIAQMPSSPFFLDVLTALPILALPTFPNSPPNVSKRFRRSILDCAAFPLPPLLPPPMQPLQCV